ncbi:EAL domain-containing protein, partial [Exiguobacterium sp. B2(2022)]|uniref:EAL domain-containing protein n=1 Tax=Exiguobacterium sp. B2(2022) TaxID=2992755 RepID=UPI00237B2C76
FARDLHVNKKTQAIVRTILFMAEEFGMDVVIEGVETLDQLMTLRRLNCRIVQGYLFSRPLRIEAFEQALENRFLMTTETGPHLKRQAFSLDATVTIHKLHDREITIGSTPILLTKSSLRTLHFYATVRLPITNTIELKIMLSHHGEEMELLVRPSSMIELENGIFDYEATFLGTSDAHRIVTALQEATHQNSRPLT